MASLKTPAIASLAVIAFAFAALPVARSADVDPVRAAWPSKWITCPGAGARSPGVYHFRKNILLWGQTDHFVIRVSADNRFVLFVNGSRVGEGPSRGDLDHWRYETFDVAPYLKTGPNTFAATVWNYGALAPTAQMSDQTGFLVQGDSPAEEGANTDASWEVKEEKGQGFLVIDPKELNDYYAASPGEAVDGARYDWDWQTSSEGWQRAITVGTGEPGRYPNATAAGTGSGVNRWLLVKDPLPHMEYSETTVGTVARSEGDGAPARLPATLPAHAHVKLLFDRKAMTTGYPVLGFSGGKGAAIRVTYAEALVDRRGQKGDRNEIEGRSIRGLTDTLVPDGGSGRTWTPLYWRAWRYLQLDIETVDDPLTIDSLGARYSGYPFVERGSVSADDPVIAKIWEVGTRTARMNAHETYMDCAYWEQLQYIGDTRIQALISYVSFGDDRLARQAMDAYDQSEIAEGLTQSRYPSSLNQVIPTFSLYWIGMIHDYWLYRPDTGPLKEWVTRTRPVIDWYTAHQRPDGLLGRMPWWNYGDWTKDFDFGVPPQEPDGGSALLSLTFAAALRDAADLEAALGNADRAGAYRRQASAIVGAVSRLCWDDERGMLADTPKHAHFSEETNAMGVLTDTVPKEHQAEVVKAVLAHKLVRGSVPSGGEFSPASIYFLFYVARAMDHAGLDDLYIDSLGPWRTMLGLGLSTWAETAEPTRSDDHAWSAHPNYDLLTLVAGIRPATPGFGTVLIVPHLGPLKELSAKMPHPSGEISTHYELSNGAWDFDIVLPKGLTGTFKWSGHEAALLDGPNHLHFAP